MQAIDYKEGLHLLVQGKQCTPVSMTGLHAFLELAESTIVELNLTKTGIVTHQFENGGYTLVIGLTESHLSVHTWPEYGIVNYDIYLSNYLEVNDDKVLAFDAMMKAFFRPQQVRETKISR
ncbi:MAG: S-adenosylmethionine decarboxylase [Bacteroidetes bacterium]|nr:S-adenosylmethionine decarboxylase [Bacteroidota bacterium]